MATFDDAVGALMIGQPFFSTLLLKLQHVETREIPTAGVNRKQLLYNPDFFATLTDDEAIFVVCHEVMHLAYQHFPRMTYYRETGMGPDGKALDWDRYNRAADYPINAGLASAKIGALPDEKRLGFKSCFDPAKFPETMTPEEVYCLLAEEEKGGKGGKHKDDKPLDVHGAGEGDGDPEVDDGADAITPADVMQAANIHKALARGNLPGFIERILGEIKKPADSPWALLRRFVTTSLPGHDDSSWRRLQRKYIVRGIGMPGPTAMGAGHIGVVIDTSGSIGQDMLDFFAGHLAAIMADARPIDVRVYWTDAKMHRMDVVKTPSDLRALMSKKVPGGGGTNMPVGVRAAEADKCDCIVVLTDGYTPFCDSPKKVMWAITSHNIKSPHGDTIHI